MTEHIQYRVLLVGPGFGTLVQAALCNSIAKGTIDFTSTPDLSKAVSALMQGEADVAVVKGVESFSGILQGMDPNKTIFLSPKENTVSVILERVRAMLPPKRE